ncbi:hypothetical protein ACJJTC_007597 [Scirpophaga incertulas]
MSATTPEITPAPSEMADDTPTPSPSEKIAKFSWLKQGRGRNSPFVKARPSLTRESSSAELVSRQNSSSDFFQNSRLNLFETAPKPEMEKKGLWKGITIVGWRDRTLLEKVMLLILPIYMLFMIVVGSALLHFYHCTVVVRNHTMCLSYTCVYTAHEMIIAMHENHDPCEDFYEFACGHWPSVHPIPTGKSSWGIFSQMELQNQHTMQTSLLSDIKPTEGGALGKARIYYDACMDKNETIEALGEKPLLSVIQNVGGWYLLPNASDGHRKFHLQTVLQEVQNTYNLGGFFNWAVSEDDRNSTRHVIVLDQGGLNLPTRDNYLNKTANKKVLSAYLDYMTRICVLLGANKTEARIQMNRVIEFETELANITIPAEDRRDEEGLYNPYTIRQWQKVAPFLNWTMFFNSAFKVVNRTISDQERIVVYAPDYFKNLTKLVTKYEKTDDGRRTLSSYMMWQVSRSLSTYLSKPFRDATKILRKALFGTEGTEEPWRYCITDTSNAVGMTPSTVNAYYTPTKNQIVFPAGILQLPFFDGLNPKSVNYGAMGVVMGHELTHAFDDQGREYDKYGNLHQWWNNATIERFKKRTECMQKQYSKYEVDGQHLNGKQTLGKWA